MPLYVAFFFYFALFCLAFPDPDFHRKLNLLTR